MKEHLAKLQLDEHYYGEYGRQWLSNSDIITLLNDPKAFRVPKEPTKAMLLGRYFHTAMLEPDKVNSVEFKSVDASSRNTKKYKDAWKFMKYGLIACIGFYVLFFLVIYLKLY